MDVEREDFHHFPECVGLATCEQEEARRRMFAKAAADQIGFLSGSDIR